MYDLNFSVRFVVMTGLLAMLLGVTPAYAHKVNVFAYIEGNKILVEGYFADGNKPMNSEVTVYDKNTDKVLLTGLTDNEGKFTFDVPALTDLRISVNAGMGHKAQYVIPRSELAGVQAAGGAKPAAATKIAAAPSAVAVKSAVPAADKAATDEGVNAPVAVDEAMVRKAVAEANLPLMRAMDELKEKQRASDIIGGIGFIIGIAGVLFYVQGRKLAEQAKAGK